MAQPDTGGVVLTGRLSVAGQPWLADHAVGGVVLFPGAGFVELAIRAGDEVGCAVVQELTLMAPLVIPADGGVAVQVVVGGVDGAGSGRVVSVYARPVGDDAEWGLHAQGVLSRCRGLVRTDLAVWPPAGAVAVDVEDAYQRLARVVMSTVRRFRVYRRCGGAVRRSSLRSALPERMAGETRRRLGIHPALLDAVLHARGWCRR